MTSTIWIILGIATLAPLAFYWNRRNAVWGGFTAGVIIGFVVAIFFVFKGSGFNWYIVGKIAVVGVALGFAAELLGMFSDYLRKKS